MTPRGRLNKLRETVYAQGGSSFAVILCLPWCCFFFFFFVITGIEHGFSCINICQVPWEVLKTEAEGRGFQHLPRDLANINALKNHVRSLLLLKNWKHLLHFALFIYLFFFFFFFFALFCFAFSQMFRERNFHGLCRSRAGQYTPRNGSKSVAPVRSYWKLRSCALTARELPCSYMAFRWLMHGC